MWEEGKQQALEHPDAGPGGLELFSCVHSAVIYWASILHQVPFWVL